MAGVDAERIGVCSWSYQRPLREVADEMAKIGVKGIDLALTPFVAPDGRHGVEEGEEALAFAKAQFASGAWRLFATMISFPQEDYSTLETIRKTGGVVPDDCWPRNREIAAAAAELSGTLGAPYMLFHAGFLDESNPAAYAAYVERVSFVRDACAREGVQLILESGQETAEDLARFLRDVPGLYVNFDPANMILYGKGRPMEALETHDPLREGASDGGARDARAVDPQDPREGRGRHRRSGHVGHGASLGRRPGRRRGVHRRAERPRLHGKHDN